MNEFSTLLRLTKIHHAGVTCTKAILETLGIATVTEEQREEIDKTLFNYVIKIDDIRKEARLETGV